MKFLINLKKENETGLLKNKSYPHSKFLKSKNLLLFFKCFLLKDNETLHIKLKKITSGDKVFYLVFNEKVASN